MPTIETTPLFALFFYVLLALFTIHTVILAYHWITYGASKKQSLISLAVFISGDSLLLITLFATLSFL